MKWLKFRAFSEKYWMTDVKTIDFDMNQIEVYVPYSEPKWLNQDDNFKLMQDTGLKDKNWVEIYEGDIVYDKMNNKFAEVKMNSFWRWSLYWINWERMNEYQGEYFFSWIYPDNHNLEIKWNIYENPELIKE